MDIKSPKDIAKLAEACRKAGILEFEGFGVKFSLSTVGPLKEKAKRQPKAAPKTPYPDFVNTAADEPIDSDYPTPEQLMNWSLPDGPAPAENS